MGSVLIVKVNSIIFHRHFENLVVNIVFENQLLNQVKCLFVVNMLSNLHHSSPGMRCELFLAVITLCVHFNEFCDEGLLDLHTVIHLFFNCDFKFDSFGVRLCPDETSIDNLCLVETFNFLQKQC